MTAIPADQAPGPRTCAELFVLRTRRWYPAVTCRCSRGKAAAPGGQRARARRASRAAATATPALSRPPPLPLCRRRCTPWRSCMAKSSVATLTAVEVRASTDAAPHLWTSAAVHAYGAATWPACRASARTRPRFDRDGASRRGERHANRRNVAICLSRRRVHVGGVPLGARAPPAARCAADTWAVCARIRLTRILTS